MKLPSSILLAFSCVLAFSGCAVLMGGDVTYSITTNSDGKYVDLMCQKSSTGTCYFHVVAEDGTIEQVFPLYQGDSIKINSRAEPVSMCVTFTPKLETSCEGKTISGINGNIVSSTISITKKSP